MKKVLIVDDDKDLLFGLAALLTNKGYRILTVDDGNQAPYTTMAFHPDVIILDVHMPNADGLTICESLKSNSMTSHIPILMISADAEIRDIMPNCHADAFMSKPLRLISLYQHLEEWTA
jgi:DNA-binding response OmpR family regulator